MTTVRQFLFPIFYIPRYPLPQPRTGLVTAQLPPSPIPSWDKEGFGEVRGIKSCGTGGGEGAKGASLHLSHKFIRRFRMDAEDGIVVNIAKSS
jgi:hypothetical protein